MRRLALVALAAAATAAAVAQAGGIPPAPKPTHGAAPWQRPDDQIRRTKLAGLKAELFEHLDYHVHSHLDIFVNGKHVTIPAAIGINIHDPGVKHGPIEDGSTAYGGIQRCKQPCISPLHTHDDTGILHTETSTPTPNRLGQFFTEWGVALSQRCVGGYCKPDYLAFYVNGKRWTGDPRRILLRDQSEIAIVIGTPPRRIPSEFSLG